MRAPLQSVKAWSLYRSLSSDRFSGDKPENRLAAKVPLLRWVPSRAAASAGSLEQP